MAFRNNKDALLARADSLQRDNDKLSAQLEGTSDERDALRAQLAKNEKALAKLTKQLARYERKSDPNAARRLPLIVAVILLLVASGAAFIVMRQASPAQAPPEVVAVPEPPKPAPAAPTAELAAVHLWQVRACLDETDLELRGMVLSERRARFSRTAAKSMTACERALARMRTPQFALPSIKAELRVFHERLALLRPVATELLRYYREGDFKDDDFAKERAMRPRYDELRAGYLAASDALRLVVAPLVARSAEIQSRGALDEMRVLAAAFVDSLVRPDANLDDVEARLAALSQYRAEHPELEFEVLGTFFKHAKELVRSMRDRGTTELDEAQAFQLATVGSYYRMSKLGAQFLAM